MTGGEAKRSRFAAVAVGAGILLSRLFGLVRERVFAHYLGSSEAAGAFKAAIRIPNMLQTLFGEGVLSASFIPVYSRLRAEGRDDEANLVARVVFTVLLFIVALAVALGIGAAPLLVDLIAPGFEGEVRALTIELVEIIFPGVGLLVLSAWCLGVLNSHGKFFLSYVAPVMWNAAQVAALIAIGMQVAGAADAGVRLAHAIAWGTVAGAGLQLGIQIPSTLRLLRRFGLSFGLQSPAVKQVFTSFVPVVIARGVVQVSAFIDEILASFIGPSAIAAMSYAQQLYLLPVSLFGMAISAAALPELSSVVGESDAVNAKLREKIAIDRTRMAFFVVPSVIAFFTIGDAIIALLFQTGKFSASDTQFVWTILAGSTIGLFAATQARLLSSAFYALSDPKTPLRFALVRVITGAIAGWSVAVPLRERFGWPPVIAAAGLTAAAGVVAWIEMLLLSRALQRRIGHIGRDWRTDARIVSAAALAGAMAFAVHRGLPLAHPLLDGAVTVGTFGIVYFGAGALLGLQQARTILKRLRVLR
jgi:putative peptidoglycan lipid II flippase